jgi:hypothetical protein
LFIFQNGYPMAERSKDSKEQITLNQSQENMHMSNNGKKYTPDMNGNQAASQTALNSEQQNPEELREQLQVVVNKGFEELSKAGYVNAGANLLRISEQRKRRLDATAHAYEILLDPEILDLQAQNQAMQAIGARRSLPLSQDLGKLPSVRVSVLEPSFSRFVPQESDISQPNSSSNPIDSSRQIAASSEMNGNGHRSTGKPETTAGKGFSAPVNN